MTAAQHLEEYRAEWRRCEAAMSERDCGVLWRLIGEQSPDQLPLLVIALRVARLAGVGHGVACLRAWIEV